MATKKIGSNSPVELSDCGITDERTASAKALHASAHSLAPCVCCVSPETGRS